jgi:hypothetical protein
MLERDELHEEALRRPDRRRPEWGNLEGPGRQDAAVALDASRAFGGPTAETRLAREATTRVERGQTSLVCLIDAG